MDLGISGRIALVAGASRGIGRATALALAKEGATLALLARSEDALEALASEIRSAGGKAQAFAGDLHTREAVDTLCRRVKEALGAPTIAVWSVASLFAYGKLHNVAADTLDELLRVEATVPARLCQNLLPDMMRAHFGRIVFVGSLSARLGVKGAPIYCMAKASLEALARSLAVDYSQYGITSNVVSLGFVDTERLRTRVEKEPDRIARYSAEMSIRRLITPEEAAAMIAFLASSRATATTGSVIDVTGGLHLANHW